MHHPSALPSISREMRVARPQPTRTTTTDCFSDRGDSFCQGGIRTTSEERNRYDAAFDVRRKDTIFGDSRTVFLVARLRGRASISAFQISQQIPCSPATPTHPASDSETRHHRCRQPGTVKAVEGSSGVGRWLPTENHLPVHQRRSGSHRTHDSRKQQLPGRFGTSFHRTGDG
jgi:hypothetical protein